MNVCVFAAYEAGYEVVKYFVEKKKEITCLALDTKDEEGWNKKILKKMPSKNIFYSDDLYKKETIRRMESLGIDLVILAWWPHIIKKPLFKVSRLGFLNMHPSLLPYNRGRHYYFWSIVEQVPFGMTLHFINENIDSGDIAFQKRMKISWEDTGFTLRERSRREILKFFKSKFDEIIAGRIPRIKQHLDKGTYHDGKDIEKASKIDLDKKYTARELINILRARSGFPHRGASFQEGGSKYEINIKIKRVSDG